MYISTTLVKPVCIQLVTRIFARVIYSYIPPFFRRDRKTAKSDYQLRHVCPSVRPHGTTRFPQE